MNSLQLELTKLIGKKELSFGCDIIVDCKAMGSKHSGEAPNTVIMGETFEGKIMIFGPDIEKKDIKGIIGHPATLSDFQKWIVENSEMYMKFYQNEDFITVNRRGPGLSIRYDTLKDLLDQSEETLTKIISLIKS